MSSRAVPPIPDGFHALTPHLACADAARAIDFYVAAYGAVELSRLPGPGGVLMHALLCIGDSMLMLNESMPERGNPGPLALEGSPVTIHLYVADADATFARAVAAGATATMPPSDMFWGDRYAQVVDPFGHRWSIATHQSDVSPEQMREAMVKMAG